MSYRITKIQDITEDSIRENAKKWLTIIRFSEYGVVIQPQDDCEYRVDQIINNPVILKEQLGPYYRKYLLGYVPIDEKDVLEAIRETVLSLAKSRNIDIPKELTTAKDVINYIVKKGYEVGLFISRINKLLEENDYKSLLELEYLLENTLNFSVIVFSQQDLTHPRYRALVDKCSLLFDYIEKFPLYSEKDCRQYIKYNNSMWSVKLSQALEDQIVASCGGYLWLISHLQRYVRDHQKTPFESVLSDEALFIKLESIFGKFSAKEQELLMKVADGLLTRTDKQTHEYRYLTDIRMIKEINGQTLLGIPLLTRVIEKEKSMKKIELKDDKVVISGREVDGFLTGREKSLIKLLLSKPHVLITRDDVAKMLWADSWHESYSDWAIDKLAYRARKKLHKLGIDEKLVKTVKRKGFIFG